MDRDTVRIILFVVGVLLIAGIYVWDRFRKPLLRRWQRRDAYTNTEPAFSAGPDGDIGDMDNGSTAYQAPLSSQPRSFATHTDTAEIDVPETVEEGSRPIDESVAAAGVATSRNRASPASRVSRAVGESQQTLVGAPFLIQVSVVAQGGGQFAGDELRDALLDLGLVHGEMDIFHRYDHHFREPLFSVASLVKPGTFPAKMEGFLCPGVVLFFQPTKVADPLAVFDDLFETSRDLADKLDGIEWDESRHPLTEDRVRQLRGRLEEICG